MLHHSCVLVQYILISEEMTEYCTTTLIIFFKPRKKIIPILYWFKSPEMARSMEAEAEANFINLWKQKQKRKWSASKSLVSKLGGPMGVLGECSRFLTEDLEGRVISDLIDYHLPP